MSGSDETHTQIKRTATVPKGLNSENDTEAIDQTAAIPVDEVLKSGSLHTMPFSQDMENTTAAAIPKRNTSMDNLAGSIPEPLKDAGRHYTIGDQLGKGGMGSVYQVDDALLDRQLAMKVLHETLMGSSELIQRFLDEARLTAQLQHPGIVPVHDMGELPDGRVFFTMKEVRGRSFKALINSVHQGIKYEAWQTTEDGWSLQRLIQTFQQICTTIAYAHAQGVIHCDLKPSNVMVGEFGEVLIVDWGIARRLWDQSEFGLRIEGTPAYMAPEQAMGIHDLIDTRTDVYALGVILFTILCGETPYSGYSVDQILNHLSTDQTAHTMGDIEEGVGFAVNVNPNIIDRHQRPVLPLALIEICERAMERDRLLRYSNAGAMADAIQAWLDGTEQRARALSVMESAESCMEEAVFLEKKGRSLLGKIRESLNSLADWESEEKKFPLWKEEEQANDMLYRASALRGQRVQYLEAALTHKPDLREAHALLLKHHLGVHAKAEATADKVLATDAAARISGHIHHLTISDPLRKKAESYLSGMGQLTLLTRHNVDVVAVPNIHQYRRYHNGAERPLGKTPLTDVTLPIGSYTLRLKYPDHPDIHLPIHVQRTESWKMVAPNKNLPHVWEIPDLSPNKECYVPAGWFHYGGDPDSVGGLPQGKAWLDGFIILKNPITHFDYLHFLNSLVGNGRLKQANDCAPREGGALLYGYSETTGFFLQPDEDGDIWEPSWPVFMITHKDAEAYAQWFSEQTGNTWRLPSELEWEKSARGVDRRTYPWGNGFEATWACMRTSTSGVSMPSRIEEHPIDTSPYGVRHMAGNLCEWTRSVYHDDGPLIKNGREHHRSSNSPYKVFKGGCWMNYPNYLRAASRYRAKKTDRFRTIGFRLVRRVD